MRGRVVAVLVASALAISIGRLVAQRPKEPPELAALVTKTTAGLDAFWRDQLLNFKPPTRVRAYKPDDPTEPCGPSAGNNAFYCFEDGGIYYDVAYLDGWRTRIGDYAAISTLAHEYGHRVQDHLGLFESRAGLFSLQKEMMADCLAGAYVRSIDKQTPLGEASRRQITLKLAELGDRETPWYHPEAHGRPGQRLDAFYEGFEGRSCTSEDFFRALGIDRDAVQLALPGRGSLRSRIKPKIDRFDLESVRWTPTLPGLGAVETIEATYQSSAKVQLKMALSAFPSQENSAKQLQQILTSLSARGFTETRRSRVSQVGSGGEGTLVVLEGAGEVVLWTHGPLFGSVEGPRDHVWEFVSAFLQ